ncbi:MAG: restriction endonuclease [Candidatus Tenebribacter burtonii]|nr:restriction endonuclease [Candidatus Tenebribacter burtonii]
MKNKEIALRNEKDKFSKSRTKEISELKKIQKEFENQKKRDIIAIEHLFKEKSIGFPWLSEAIADYIALKDESIAYILENKSHPALKAAEEVRKISKEKRIFKKEYQIAKYFVSYYESLFPWLQDFIGDNLDSLIRQIREDEMSKEENEDPVRHYVSHGEYETLSTMERNQKALDRYKSSRKEPWKIGRDFERYVGYIYETKGYNVYYQGIELGLKDLGRDLICKKNGEIEIVQCKYWSRSKLIHEKHINQLFGTTIKYIIDLEQEENRNQQLYLFADYLKNSKILATFITSTKLSETANKFAKALGIKVKENVKFDFDYPCIKCNISKMSGEKIYHLPFDQQYDNTIIEIDKGEFYVATVAEAEDKGFRRAWRWHGSESNK